MRIGLREAIRREAPWVGVALLAGGLIGPVLSGRMHAGAIFGAAFGVLAFLCILRRARAPAPPVETAPPDPLESAAPGLRALLTDTEKQLMGARRKLGREDADYDLINDLTSQARAIRKALEAAPERARTLSADLRRRLPLIASVAAGWATLKEENEGAAAIAEARRTLNDSLRALSALRGRADGSRDLSTLEIEAAVLDDRLGAP